MFNCFHMRYDKCAHANACKPCMMRHAKGKNPLINIKTNKPSINLARTRVLFRIGLLSILKPMLHRICSNFVNGSVLTKTISLFGIPKVNGFLRQGWGNEYEIFIYQELVTQ